MGLSPRKDGQTGARRHESTPNALELDWRLSAPYTHVYLQRPPPPNKRKDSPNDSSSQDMFRSERKHHHQPIQVPMDGQANQHLQRSGNGTQELSPSPEHQRMYQRPGPRTNLHTDPDRHGAHPHTPQSPIRPRDQALESRHDPAPPPTRVLRATSPRRMFRDQEFT